MNWQNIKSNPWILIAYGLVIGLIAAGLILLIISPTRGEPIQIIPPPTPSPLLVHVSGAVQNPGVYSLPVGSRIVDVIQAAGGLLPEASEDEINLAAFLIDGQKIYIPRTGEEIPSSMRMESNPDTKININTATAEELDSLPGIGNTKAEAVISYRQQNGPFQAIEDILNVPGIGPTIFEQIKEYITTGTP